MDELPKLPFLKVLSYLSLRDRLMLSAVSRSCHQKVINSRMKSLCYSKRPMDSILGKSRWVNGTFTENFISSTRFASFFDTFGQTILSTLKHLRLCEINLTEGDSAAFARTLNSFRQLEQLDIIRANCGQQREFNLNLPMLTSLQLEKVNGIEKLTLEAPRLREVKILDCSHLRLKIVHSESVERLLVDRWEYTEVKKLKNLQYLYVKDLPAIDSMFLSSLWQLKEIHLQNNRRVSKLFEQKSRSGRADLKIYLCGLLLNGPDDPARNALGDSSFEFLRGEWLVCLAKNPSRLADQIPFYRSLDSTAIEKFVPPGLEANLLKRCTDLNEVIAYSPVQDIERFLSLLKNFESIVELEFRGAQPQDLFDRLPEHCAVQKLIINNGPSDLAFLFRLKHLIELYVDCPINRKTFRRAFEELPVLSRFGCWKAGRYSEFVSVETICHNQFKVSIGIISKVKIVSDLKAAIEFLF